MSAEEYAQLVGALKALGGVGGAALVLGVLWNQFLREARENKKKVAQDQETRLVVVEKRTQGISDAYRDEISELKQDVAVLLDRSGGPRPRAQQLSDGPTVTNYPNPLKRRTTKSLPAVEPESEPLEEEEKT